jgi:acetyl-CoA carboxylase biotin carboxyl carrier protein
MVASVPVVQTPAVEAAEQASVNAKEDDNLITVKSPIIGTFYRKASPDKPVFVEIGQEIKEGDVLCVIEAMKLFNEIESEVQGKIVKILVDDSTPVEFDQPLFLVDPS